MSIQNVSKIIDNFWISKGVKPQKTENGYYMFVMPTWKLYIYPEDEGATFMVIPTSKKYNIRRNLNIETEIGIMEVDANPNRSNPALLYAITKEYLNNNFIDMLLNKMVHIVENQFDTFKKNQ